MHKPESVQGNENSVGFWDTNESLNPNQKIRPRDYLQKKWTSRLVDSAVPTDHRVKIKES